MSERKYSIHCPKCNQKLNAPEKLLGKRIKCPKCKEPFHVTAVSEQKSPEPVNEDPESGSPSTEQIPLHVSFKSVFSPKQLVVLTVGIASLIAVGVPPHYAIAGFLLISFSGSLWQVHSNKGSYIQFGESGLTYFKSGKMHNLALADLQSIRCPTESERKIVDLVQLKFRNGPTVSLLTQNHGFAEAKEGILRLLQNNPTNQDYTVKGDMELPGGKVDEHANLASRSSRFNATLIDAVILGTVTNWVMFPIVRAMQQPLSPTAISLCCLVVYCLINGYRLVTHGQSMGKMLLRIQIVDQDSNEVLSPRKLFGQRVAPIWLALAIPSIVLPTSGIVSLPYMLDSVFIFRGNRRCVHDMLAGSKVVRRPSNTVG